jgi:ATP-dependent RNA helicase DeaD
VADLRARQIEITVAAIREALAADDLDDYQPFLNALNGDDSLRNVALAAIKLAHEASGATVDEAEIPDASHRMDRSAPNRREHSSGGDQQRNEPADAAFLYIGLGRKAGIRPADLVGAIANETGLAGRQIGPIRITETYSVVGVPARQAAMVTDALRTATIKGKKPTVRPYDPSGAPSGPKPHRGAASARAPKGGRAPARRR